MTIWIFFIFKHYLYKLDWVWICARGTGSCEVPNMRAWNQAVRSQTHLNCWVISTGSRIGLLFFFFKKKIGFIYVKTYTHEWVEVKGWLLRVSYVLPHMIFTTTFLKILFLYLEPLLTGRSSNTNQSICFSGCRMGCIHWGFTLKK